MYKQDSTINTAVTAPPALGEALCNFYPHSFYVFLRPSPASFAEVASNTRWTAVWLQITFMTLITGLLAFFWGRLSLFTPATTLTRPLPISSALIVTFAVPVMFFIIGGITFAIAKALDGKGTFLAQTYTTLLLYVPIFILSIIAVIVSLHAPVLGSILALLDLLLLLYSIVLQVFSMMAVHSIGPWKATLIVLLQTIAIIAIVLVLAFVFFVASSDSTSSDSNSSSSSSNKSGGDSKKTDTGSGESVGTVEVVDPFLYPAYPGYRRYASSSQSGPSSPPANPTTSVPDMHAPTVELSEASCPTCYYTEWAGPLRVNTQLPCIHCGTQMRPTGNTRQGEPPQGYIEVQCPQYHYHEWTAQHRLDAGVMCVHCGLKMQPTGKRW